MSVRTWSLSARDNLNLYVFIGVVMLCGAIFGVMLVNALTFEQQQELADELGVYLSSAGDPLSLQSSEAFWSRFALYFKWMGLIWLLGLSVIGLPLVLALDFMKGMLIGFAVGLFVRQLEWEGVLVSLAAVAPQNAVVVPAFMLASVSASRFAYYIVRERLFRKKGKLLPPFLQHSAVAFVMLLLLGCAAAYEAYLSPMLLELVVPAAADV